MSDDLVKKMNETAITPELLGAVSEMHLALPANEATDMASCVGHIFGLLTEKGYTQDECDLLSLAIYYRMVALAELIERGDTRGWTLPDAKPGAHSLDANLVQAAAEEPLIEGADGHPAFDKKNLQQRVLRIAGARGKA